MITNAELKTLLNACKKRKALSGDILKAVEDIAKRFLHGSDYADEIVQLALLRFCKIWRKIDTSKNIFAYLSSLVRNEARMFFRSLKSQQKLLVHESRFSTGFDFIVASQEFPTREIRSICC